MENGNEINEKSTFKKGIELEKEFAEYIREEMKYDKIKIRFQVKQANNSMGANIDIIGQRLNETGIRLKRVSKWYFIMCVIVVFYALLIGIMDSFYNDWTLALFISGLILEIVGLFALIISSRYNIDNIWVECKNLKTKSNITQVNKMLNEIKSYKNSGDTQYKFKEFAFVSTSGFVNNAIELAIANNIKCFVKENNEFGQITNWN
jgi:hypothetical protein